MTFDTLARHFETLLPNGVKLRVGLEQSGTYKLPAFDFIPLAKVKRIKQFSSIVRTK